MDAAGLGLILAENRYISREDAEYVQLIISDPEGFLSKGTSQASGHDHIYLTEIPISDKHCYAIDFHYYIMKGAYVVIADPNGVGEIRTYYKEKITEKQDLVRPPIREDQCLVGIYSTSHARNIPRNFTVPVGTHLPHLKKKFKIFKSLSKSSHQKSVE